MFNFIKCSNISSKLLLVIVICTTSSADIRSYWPVLVNHQEKLKSVTIGVCFTASFVLLAVACSRFVHEKKKTAQIPGATQDSKPSFTTSNGKKRVTFDDSAVKLASFRVNVRNLMRSPMFADDAQLQEALSVLIDHSREGNASPHQLLEKVNSILDSLAARNTEVPSHKQITLTIAYS